MPSPLILPLFPFTTGIGPPVEWSSIFSAYGGYPTWGISGPGFFGNNFRYTYHSLNPQGCGVSDNGDGTCTVSLSQAAWDGSAAGAFESGNAIATLLDTTIGLPSFWWMNGWRADIPVLGVTVSGTRDDNFGVNITMAWGGDAEPEITHTVIDWGDGNTETLGGQSAGSEPHLRWA